MKSVTGAQGAAVDRRKRGEYITLPPAAGPELARLCGLVFPTSNGVDRPSRFACCGRESEIDRLGGFPVFDSAAGSLTIWFEEREAWTARSLRALREQRRERDFGGLRIL